MLAFFYPELIGIQFPIIIPVNAVATIPGRHPAGYRVAISKISPGNFWWLTIPGRHPAGYRVAISKISPGNFWWLAIPGRHPAGYRIAISKISPGNFLNRAVSFLGFLIPGWSLD
ncbi:hypothetical protein [Dickeya zeae]|uniref:Uncharacterized protein n=1 Tax=Dickeya zeae TaxID=204042 RepID=A0ABX8W5N2_9GAMM|nr:hypothetical protein [Dickeya zeae]QYM93259.1 hypothetical protein FGI21_16045 [Dickeya zeae]